MGIALGATEIADLKLGTSQVDKVYLGSNVVWQKSAPVAIKALKFSSSGAQTLGLNTAMLGSITPNFEYSLDDGATWTAWTVSNPISFGNGTDLYVRGTNTKLATTGNNYTQFVFSTASPVACSGNVMHLFDHTQDLTAFPATAGGDTNDRGLKYLFKDCTALTSAPDLPATTLATYCYYYMFSGCAALTTAPVLPATSLTQYCYESMFSGCTALTSAPELPATSLTINCYYSMFADCVSLVALPALSHATFAGAGACTQMFKGCSSIKMSLSQEGDYQNAYTFGFTPSNSNAQYMFMDTGGTFTGTPTQTTLYTSNTVVGA